MNLSQAIRYGSYPGAVSCQYRYHWYSLANYDRTDLNNRRILAHVCRQGGYGVREWWTVSFDRIVWEQVPERWQFTCGGKWWFVARHDLGNVASFGSIDGCYKWLRDQMIDPYNGWYPTKNEKRWDELGSRQ